MERGHGKRWSLPSSSGRERLSGELVRTCRDRSGRTFLLSRIELTALLWPRDGSGPDLVSDFSVRLEQVGLLREAVEALSIRAAAWMSSREPFSVELCGGGALGQSLMLAIGERPGVIIDLGKAACTVRYRDFTFDLGEWKFVVDETCVRELHSGLTEMLSVVGGMPDTAPVSGAALGTASSTHPDSPIDPVIT
jgi:hypothetical protein